MSHTRWPTDDHLRITLVGRLSEDAQMRLSGEGKRPCISVRFEQAAGRAVCGVQTYTSPGEAARHAAQQKARAMRRGALVGLHGIGPMTLRGGRLLVTNVTDLRLLDGPRGRMAAANDRSDLQA